MGLKTSTSYLQLTQQTGLSVDSQVSKFATCIYDIAQRLWFLQTLIVIILLRYYCSKPQLHENSLSFYLDSFHFFHHNNPIVISNGSQKHVSSNLYSYQTSTSIVKGFPWNGDDLTGECVPFTIEFSYEDREILRRDFYK